MWWVGCGTNQGAHDFIKKKASNCKVLVSYRNTDYFCIICCLTVSNKWHYAIVSRSSYSFADERDANITQYCRLTFPACDWVKI